MTTSEPPCRICGSSRDAHGTAWNHDHRYRATRYCEMGLADGSRLCGKEATWYVDGLPMCPAHKGIYMRDRDPWDVSLDKIERNR